MDSSVYALVGALGGVLITQVANYFLERKRMLGQRDLKSLELQKSRDHDLYKERRIAYAKYLEAVDLTAASFPKDMSLCVGQLYAALVVASDGTSKEINKVFSYLKREELISADFLAAKARLLKSMQSDLQS
ncbi:hypothetical protein [Aeromonas hydrophila]|uniref:hypothetical protein n=1 Tax=Aeromonas hydrophila TaxID=644 RepID=UPI0020A05CFE|nr:hypothetical protein [Aeromonas hydrophila]MCP1268223.1 hypothetical protein [Aeromonas hydrophila]MCP1296724.1 hypothetical protein [Aeromonas hydrophila]